ncbi:hypothetical protein CcaCcLH18_13136 [Colletotrichum camelliae]|nr:hypothetical protein CcaCcLH18_13136 [Colletotrichum camelliae]
MPRKKNPQPKRAFDDGPKRFWAYLKDMDPLRDIGFPGVMPRYLFRVYDADSLGTTSTSVISSRYAKQTLSNQKNLFTDDTGPRELYNHLKWSKKGGASNLVSWTSSLLFAIQLGLYKHKSRPLSQTENDLSKVFILMIDTTKLPPATFIRDTAAMLFFRRKGLVPADHQAFDQLRSKSGKDAFYFGEYLSQGRFSAEGTCSQTSLQKLIDHGLFEFCPYFEQKGFWNGLASRVVKIRQNHFYVALPTTSFQPNERTAGRKAVTMAQACFGDAFALPFALMVLSMSPVNDVTQVLFSSIVGMFSDEELDCLLPSKMKINSDNLVEVQDFETFVHHLNSLRRESRATSLTDKASKPLHIRGPPLSSSGGRPIYHSVGSLYKIL